MLPHGASPLALPSNGPAPKLTLRLPSAAKAVRYEATICWETFANGDYQTSTVTKQVALALQAAANGSYRLDLRTSSPTLRKSGDLQSLEAVAVRLAALYEWLVIEVAPTGHFLALSNHDAVCRTWEVLARSLQESTTADDQITPTLLRFIGQQLQDPATFLDSLRHDYLYQTLVLDRYGQLLGGPNGTDQPRQFASFFDKLPLCFTEEVDVVSPPTDEAISLRLRGTLAPEKTDVAAIARLMAQAVGPAAASAGAPHFHYTATYVLDPHDGLPLSVALTVYGRLTDLYNKQYTLTISRV